MHTENETHCIIDKFLYVLSKKCHLNYIGENFYYRRSRDFYNKIPSARGCGIFT